VNFKSVCVNSFHSIYDGIPVVIVFCDKEGKVLHCNKACLELLGLGSEEEYIGSNIFEQYNLSEEQRGAVVSKGNCTFSLRYQASKNNYLFLEITIAEHEGNYLVTIVNHTEQVNRGVEAEIKQLKRYYDFLDKLPLVYTRSRLIFNDQGEIVDLINISGNHCSDNFAELTKVPWYNTELTKMFPFTAKEIIYNVNEIYKKGEDSGTFFFYITEADEHMQMIVVFESDRWANLISVPLTNIVKGEQMELAMLQNMSHDLRTPLNAIVGLSQILGLPDGYNTEEEKLKYNSYIKNNADMLQMLLEDVLNVSELKDGIMRMEYEDCIFNEVCRNSLSSIDFRVPEGVETEFITNIPDYYTIKTDGRRVQQVLMNYLSNACKHTESGKITLVCNVDEAEKKVKLSVIDTGEGVPDAIRDNLFDRFVHLGEIKDSHGIGLNICLRIAKLMNGSVSLDTSYPSDPSTTGAKFDFEFPLVKVNN